MKHLIANWKMNFVNLDAWLKDFDLNNIREEIQVVVCPNYLDIKDFYKTTSRTYEKISIGAQNLSSETEGAFTGQISGKMLRNIGVSHSIVGHSESRLQGEDDETILNKVKTALHCDLIPILCIGEDQHEYSKGRTEKKIKHQLTENLFPLQNLSNNILIAYEPIYAIGSGIAVQNEHLEEVSLLVKDLVRENLGTDFTLIYGGSVTSESAKNLAKVDGIDGFLVGNASLDPKEFANIALSLEQ